ncbi:sulfate adenylyltransferase [Desmospora profundinema]|uniref:Sulfate adenylyltransferase n=1 Tax=Desmospora profundinema TaxID=1571184 RepID=A0ABU1IRH8_9BACL|nr:sulfate adenylyltransferase [Desmospora profundinema]MDR6227396.1 sulfate adenylyltransferase [Desmospora profundinema]
MVADPHGGRLVDQVWKGERRQEGRIRAVESLTVPLSDAALADVECLATGVFSPLHGFLTEDDYHSVRDQMCLADGTVWSIPITLPVPEGVREGNRLGLTDRRGGDLVALMEVESVFEVDPVLEAERVFGTSDREHPGVKRLFQEPVLRAGGPVYLLRDPRRIFSGYPAYPLETREHFQQLGWRTVVGFQTRNPVHRAHEYIQKCALEVVDGLFLHPLVGPTKADDIPADVRMRSYEAILESYFPKNRVCLGIFPAAMRYAGPREAVFHALVRKNYGCTHFIVGRDHAGVGDYYGTYEAQELVRSFTPEELGIQPLFFEHSFYCRRCQGMASFKTCSHSSEDRLILSGTKVRGMLQSGITPPPEYSRPEVVEVLLEAYQKRYTHERGRSGS